MSPPPIIVLTTQTGLIKNISFVRPSHVPKFLGQKGKSNHYGNGDPLRATNKDIVIYRNNITEYKLPVFVTIHGFMFEALFTQRKISPIFLLKILVHYSVLALCQW